MFNILEKIKSYLRVEPPKPVEPSKPVDNNVEYSVQWGPDIEIPKPVVEAAPIKPAKDVTSIKYTGTIYVAKKLAGGAWVLFDTVKNEYVDLKSCRYTWSKSSIWFIDCQGTLPEIEGKLKKILNPPPLTLDNDAILEDGATISKTL